MPVAKVAIVTGANRGIGLAICKTLANTISEPLVLYATSRSATFSLGANVNKANPSVEIRYDKLSLTDEESVSALVEKIKKEHGGCDVLINNAGLYYYTEHTTSAQRKETMDVNYRGTLKAFLPILREHGRIVNLSSQSGLLKYMSQPLRARFLNPTKTLQDVETLAEEYENAATAGTANENGWPSMTYFTSKAALNAATSILARENPGFLINCCCPGWVSTDLGNQAGLAPKTVEDGAKIPIRLGFGDIGGVSGKYWANDSVYDTGEGEVADF
ncbi:MAG: hypothetical protein Q9215_007409 [Flavoplaca cf. flavocitrina]